MPLDPLTSRYRALRRMQGGAQGEVWEGEDTLLGGPVVLKWLGHGDGLDWLRQREVAALMALDLPGVVRVLDDGWATDPAGARRALLVLERAEGAPFPRRRTPWDALAGPAVALLQVLRGVHAAGVVHRDLKPSHILISDKLTLIDFGLACGAGVSTGGPRRRVEAGTLRYMAPEQLFASERADPRSDLYALGLLLYEALSDAPPHPLEPGALRRARLSGAPPRLRAPGAPPAVVALVEALLARQPSDRPASAEEALIALGAGAAEELAEARRGWSASAQEDLARLFAGPERLFHRREDAMRVLALRAGEAVEDQAEELSAWIAAGLARWQEGLIQVEPRDLRRLEAGLPLRFPASAEAPRTPEQRARAHAQLAGALPPASTARLRHLIAAGDAPGAVQAARDAAQACWARGEVDRALEALDQGLALARANGLAEREDALLRELARVAPAANGRAALRRAHYELLRATPGLAGVTGLEPLLRALGAARAGRVAEAEAALAAVPEFAEEALDRWRLAAAVDLAQHQGEAALSAAVAAAAAWAAARGTVTAEADAEGWAGLLAYSRGDFSAAAAHQRRAVAGKVHGTGVLSARVNLAAALLELAEHAEVQQVAAQIQGEAARLRLPTFEAIGAWLGRAAAYRAGEVDRADLELAEAAGHLGGDWWPGLIWLNEATVAWRGGERAVAAALVGRAVGLWRGSADPVAVLARALAAALSGEEVAQVAEEAAALRAGPGVALQALGVLFWAAPPLRERYAARAAALAAALPEPLRQGRRELMTLEEVTRGIHTPAPPAMRG